MKNKQILYLMAMAFLIVVPGMTNALNAKAGRPALVSKILVTGQVSIINSAEGGWLVCPGLSVRRNGIPVSGLDVRLEGIRLKETVPGYYADRLTSIMPIGGQTLQFSIHSPLPAPLPHALLPEKIAITGTGTIASLATIVQPVSGSSLSAASLGSSLLVTWKGGVAPFTLGLMKPSGSAVLSIFEQTGLPGFSYPLPATLLPPGLTYTIIVMYSMEPFVLQTAGKEIPSPLDKSSSVIMSGSTIVKIVVY